MSSTQRIRIAIAQINQTVGDLQANLDKLKKYVELAKKEKADIVAFPELAICGYPPEDLLLKNRFIKSNIFSVNELAKTTKDIVAVVGFVDKRKGKLYNAAAIIADRKIKAVYHKVLLPNYGVFDERRYFSPGRDGTDGTAHSVFKIGEVNFAVNICEDIWDKNGPLYYQARQGTDLIININASPYHRFKRKQRESLIIKQAKTHNVFIVYNNLIGGQDELVFDGQSFIVNNRGKILTRLSAFCEELKILDINLPIRKEDDRFLVIKKDIQPKKPKLQSMKVKVLNPIEEVYKALVLGLKDYVSKNGFTKVVIGLSGGVDSSLVAALAVDALGSDNVKGVFMPSLYSSSVSGKDAYKLAENLNIQIQEISIKDIFDTYLAELIPAFKGKKLDTTEENLQARIRGNILMALSNKFGWLVLATGNKSEVSCGYCTLYGDMAGGFNVIKDVPKTLVYKLAKYRNLKNKKIIIPERVIKKEPSAELRYNQKDSDSLPVYSLLDKILKKYVEEDKSIAEIIKAGFSKKDVLKAVTLVDRNEYKRRQAAPGIKITPKAFGRDRRMPITNRFLS